jgi:hypothetical protein
MAVFGASRPLPRVPAKVPSLNRHRPFALGRGNASSCPTPAVRDSRWERLSWVETGHCVWCDTRNLGHPFRRSPAASRKDKPSEAFKL